MAVRFFLMLFAVFISPMFGAHASDNAKMFVVDMRVLSNNEPIVTPQMMVAEGQEASVGQAGPEGVAVGLIITDAGEQRAHVLAEVELPGGQISPDLTVLLGQWASITDGDVGFEIRVQASEAMAQAKLTP